MNKLTGWKRMYAVFLALGAAAMPAPAQTFKTLVNFDGSNGGRPAGALIQGTDGDFYGTTSNFGNTNPSCPNGCGTIFKITPSGILTTLYMFNGTDGDQSLAGLIQGTDGNFYGTTEMGGNLNCFPNDGCGTVFKMTADGSLTTLYEFNGSDGEFPSAGLVEAADGSLYGTTSYGGIHNVGTVFKITPEGAFTSLYSFCPANNPYNCPDGYSPNSLVQAADGDFYGTTYGGGADSFGTVFKISAGGELSTLHSFFGEDGSLPVGALIQSTDGNLYGATVTGGNYTGGPLCVQQGCGTIFKITPQGTFTTEYSFCSEDGCSDGALPESGLVQATDGNFYGVTSAGGSGGTLFKITTGRVLTVLHTFENNTDGSEPIGALLQATSGIFYGTTYDGGVNNYYGTVFGLNVGLGPFVETNPVVGKVGRTVGILGNNLKGTTSVSFNGTSATFTVKSGSYIKAAVPAGATSGYVNVTTPNGTLTSNVPFHVIP